VRRTFVTLYSVSAPVSLSTALSDVSGITPKQAEALGALGLTRLGHLIAHLPLRHEKIEAESRIADLVAGQIVSARGEITAMRPVRRGKPRIEAVLHDGTGRLDLVFFNQMYRAEQLHPGTRVRVQGKTRTRGPGLQMANPSVDVIRDAGGEPGLADERVRPVYPASEQVKSWQIERVITKILPIALPLLQDHLPETLREARRMPRLADAYRMQHKPETLDEAKASRRRLAYDELLMLQIGVALKRAHLRQDLKAPALKFNEAIDRHIRERLPFKLTEGQEAVIKDLAKDLSSETPTNRLIQGDVGSGKTLVALYAMLIAVAAKKQASLMAPTELLAEQHFNSITRMLQGSRVRVELLTGSTPKADRESILSRLAAGDIDILIGTHALLTQSVQFHSLAVAVIDEQHRFGVHQRATLREKASDEATTPHVIVMTATPIPRTLAITLFGDLDISTINGLPPGRRPIATRVVTGDHRPDVFEELGQRIARGEQGYIVVPAIDPTHLEPTDNFPEGSPLRDVRTVQKELEERWLPGGRVAAVHGQLSRATREAVMERFRLGQIDALVATTVIEVGVDVPNAAIMIVDQADRFGLAQLHQLRGRVGRGHLDSACFLISDAITPEAQQRLAVMEQTTDGFVLAEKDLEIRGPGEVFGSRQSGLPPFKVADLMRDRDLLALAKRDAAEWVALSPKMQRPEDRLILRRLTKAFGKELGLADVG
jgi:ATP-dependent DNA helicase RecG